MKYKLKKVYMPGHNLIFDYSKVIWGYYNVSELFATLMIIMLITVKP